jgi:hypothetical protein
VGTTRRRADGSAVLRLQVVPPRLLLQPVQFALGPGTETCAGDVFLEWRDVPPPTASAHALPCLERAVECRNSSPSCTSCRPTCTAGLYARQKAASVLRSARRPAHGRTRGKKFRNRSDEATGRQADSLPGSSAPVSRALSTNSRTSCLTSAAGTTCSHSGVDVHCQQRIRKRIDPSS